MGSNTGRVIPKVLKMVPVATFLDAQLYKASTGFSSPNTYRTTNFPTLTKINKSEKVREDRMEDWQLCLICYPLYI